MAMIGGQTPNPAELPVDYKRRVVVKFRPDVRLALHHRRPNTIRQHRPARVDRAHRRSSGHRARAFLLHPARAYPALVIATAASQRAAVPPSFTQYFAIECPAGVDPEAVARAVASWSNVDTAYVEAGPTPPPVNSADDPRNADQHYEDAAPTGIDVRWAWTQADGSGVGFVDMERGWTLNHEDLVAAGISVISGVNNDYTGHGTAVLGEVVMVDNTIGGVGIAPFASARVVSQWRTASTYNTAEAILSAVAVMNSGDVLLLEAQTTSSTMSGYLPVEVEQAAFDAIQYATSQGIIVIEAAGNGGKRPRHYQDSNGKFILNRNSNDFRDSGAIMVGAASSVHAAFALQLLQLRQPHRLLRLGRQHRHHRRRLDGQLHEHVHHILRRNFGSFSHRCRLRAHRAVLAHQARRALFAIPNALRA